MDKAYVYVTNYGGLAYLTEKEAEEDNLSKTAFQIKDRVEYYGIEGQIASVYVEDDEIWYDIAVGADYRPFMVFRKENFYDFRIIGECSIDSCGVTDREIKLLSEEVTEVIDLLENNGGYVVQFIRLAYSEETWDKLAELGYDLDYYQLPDRWDVVVLPKKIVDSKLKVGHLVWVRSDLADFFGKVVGVKESMFSLAGKWLPISRMSNGVFEFEQSTCDWEEWMFTKI